MRAADPAVELVVSVAEPVVHNSRTRAEITRLAGNEALLDVRNAGVTRSRTEVRIEPRYRLASYPDGRVCVMLEALRATWQVVDLTVDVASEYAPGSCQYREVRAHEDEHVRITGYTLRQFGPILKARLERAAAASVPRWDRAGSRDAVERMTRSLSAAGSEVLAEFQADLKRRNAAIDTPESYREVSKRCKTW